jgi:Leucine-rich repeat (LRR) protein
MLGGSLPSNIGEALPSLQILYLGDNKFEGHVPASLGNASNLEELDLPNNRFDGEIPSSFGKLSGMTSLNLERNNLESKDSAGWEFLDALANCRYLEVISLADNLLE